MPPELAPVPLELLLGCFPAHTSFKPADPGHVQPVLGLKRAGTGEQLSWQDHNLLSWSSSVRAAPQISSERCPLPPKFLLQASGMQEAAPALTFLSGCWPNRCTLLLLLVQTPGDAWPRRHYPGGKSAGLLMEEPRSRPASRLTAAREMSSGEKGAQPAAAELQFGFLFPFSPPE